MAQALGGQNFLRGANAPLKETINEMLCTLSSSPGESGGINY